MPKIERYLLLFYEGNNYEFHNCEPSDTKAIIEAIRSLEKKLRKTPGGLMKHYKNNPDDIVVSFWGGK